MKKFLKHWYLKWLLIGTVVLFSPLVWAKKIALLVGVSQYANPSHNLQGPEYDVRAWQELLQKNFAVPASDIVVLLNDKATKNNILQELDRLQKRSQAGDEIIIFFSGHGTSALDKGQLIPLPQGTGAFVTHEKQFLIGRTDIFPRLLALDKDRKIWLISDSCYSQNMARSMNQNLVDNKIETPKAKYIPVQRGEILSRLSGLEKQTLQQLESSIPAYPYQNTVTLAAASEGEVALDLPGSDTFDAQPHGALTNALIPILMGQNFADFDGNRTLDANEVHYALTQQLRSMSLAQTPQLLPSSVEDKHSLRLKSFLGSGQKNLMTMRPVTNGSRLKVFLAKSVPASLQDQLKNNPNLEIMSTAKQYDIAITAQAKYFEFFDAKNESIGRFTDFSDVQAKLSQEQFNWSLKNILLKKQNGVMELELLPNRFGSFYEIGEKLRISMKSPRSVYLVLLVINSKAELSVIYPTQSKEWKIKVAHQVQLIPDSDFFTATPPSGVDYLHVMAWSEMPEGLKDRLTQPLESLHVSHQRVQDFISWLSKTNEAMLYNTVEIVVHEVTR